MINERNYIYQQKWLRVLLIFAVIYFSQFYPYIHLHHAHNDSILPFEFSFHPLDVDIEHYPEHPDHHNENDHHHTYDNKVDWHIYRSYSQSIVSSGKLIGLPVFNIEESEKKELWRIESAQFLKYHFFAIDPFEKRGPPQSA